MKTEYRSGYVCDGVPITAVTSILKSDSRHKSGKKSSALSNQGKVSARNMFATNRGLAVHRAVNTFLSTGEVDLEEKYFPYFNNIYEQLQHLNITDILWNEGPVAPQLQHLQQGEHACVWDKKRKYGGCPDVVGSISGLRCLLEWKTAGELFQDSYRYKDFKNYSNYLKYTHAAQQVAAYKNCFEKTTGIDIDLCIIVVATRDDSQLFYVENDVLPKHLKDFHKLNSAYQKSFG